MGGINIDNIKEIENKKEIKEAKKSGYIYNPNRCFHLANNWYINLKPCDSGIDFRIYDSKGQFINSGILATDFSYVMTVNDVLFSIAEFTGYKCLIDMNRQEVPYEIMEYLKAKNAFVEPVFNDKVDLNQVLKYLELDGKYLNSSEISNMFCDLCDSDIGINLQDKEVADFNKYIKNNNFNGVIEFFTTKLSIIHDVLKTTIQNNYDSAIQFIMEQCYQKWDKDMSRDEFVNSLTEYEKLAVCFGNFNYQVENGGLEQWIVNDYASDIGFMKNFLENSGIYQIYTFRLIELLEQVENVVFHINELDKNDESYDRDVDDYFKTLDFWDNEYYDYNKDWLSHFNDYLIERMPNEYIEIVTNYNKSNIGI